MRLLVFRLVAGFPQGVRIRLARRGPVGWLFRRLWRWLGARPVPIKSGATAGLLISTAFDPTHVQAPELARGTLEPHVQLALRRCLKRGAVFYDIGANLGFFSLLAASSAGPHGRVYALEPVPMNAAIVRRNAALNGFANITVLECAASSTSGSTRLQLIADLSWSMLDRSWRHPQTRSVIDVEAVSIDDLVAAGRASPPDVVKLDVEGAELEVIAGMRATIARHRPIIICELHGTASAFFALVRAAGYTAELLEVAGGGEGVHAIARPG